MIKSRTHHGGALVNVLALLMALEITALGLLAGYLILTGRIDDGKVWLFSEVYDGRLTAETLAMAEQWNEHQAQEAARKAAIPAGAAAPVKLAGDVAQQQTSQLANEWQLQEIRALKSDLELQVQQLRQQREALEKQQKKIDEQLKGGSPTEEASFQEIGRAHV